MEREPGFKKEMTVMVNKLSVNILYFGGNSGHNYLRYRIKSYLKISFSKLGLFCTIKRLKIFLTVSFQKICEIIVPWPDTMIKSPCLKSTTKC